MDNGIHFISGLPRSGSTLLSALLRQNPRINASVTSPVGRLFLAMLREMSEEKEGSVFIDDDLRTAVLKSLFDGYYHNVHPQRLVFDTNRLWCSKLPTLLSLFPKAKIICCVRDIPWIYDSVESLIRRNCLQLSSIFNFEAGGTVYDRFDAMNRSTGLVGFAWTALRQAYFSRDAGQMLLVNYESLIGEPQRTLDAIYDFIGEKRFTHSFDTIDFDMSEFDRRLGTPGLHVVGRTIRKEVRTQTILPPELFNRVAGDSFWKDPATNVFGATII